MLNFINALRKELGDSVVIPWEDKDYFKHKRLRRLRRI